MLEKREWLVTGTDCQTCDSRIKRALKQTPGVESVEFFPFEQRLRITFDQTLVGPQKIESTVRNLGYAIMPREGGANVAAVGANGSAVSNLKWKMGKELFVVIAAALLAFAWSTSIFLPEEFRIWPFIVACGFGLVPVARRAVADARSGQPFTVEALMTVAVIGALLIGAAQEAALVVFLFALGELLESFAAKQARSGIQALGTLVPKTALREDPVAPKVVPVSDLIPGDVVLVRAGDRIPADGAILSGTSSIDESPVTGESIPVTRVPGDPVFAGAINIEGTLRIRVSRAAADNTIARIVRLVEQAEESRAPTERFIDRFSKWYMPMIVGLSAFVAVVPPLFLGHDWSTWIYRGLSLLLIGCPCALVISVPAAVASALAAGTSRGLLVKGGAVLEASAKIKTVAFDKTGTLTQGQPVVTDIVTLAGMSEKECLVLAAAIESTSSHPLAQAILRRAEGVTLPPLQNTKALPGRGVTAMIGRQAYTVSSPRHAIQDGVLNDVDAKIAAALEKDGKTVVVLYAAKVLAFIGLRDEPRADAGQAIRQLRNLGVTSVILTGDNARTAAAIATVLDAKFEAELLPEQKQEVIRSLAANGPVMMVGDGINDAPALKQAAVGVAIGSGTDVALETADAAILRNRVEDIPALIRLARLTMSTIRQNVALALGLKGVFLVTSIMGMTGLWVAILADTGATVLVTLNALRLLRSGQKVVLP